MGSTKKSWKELFLRAFGASRHEASSDGPLELRIYLHVPRPHADERVLVGSLRSTGDVWRFEYDEKYADDPARPPISAFPDKTRTYEAERLWPFFDVRLPPLEREDVRAIVEEHNLEERDKLRLLGFLSRRAVTSPYEFELAGGHA